jgi:iron-sulfur cluster repair protein YtfE (RIC family)
VPVTLGKPRTAHGIEDMLLECHERIRSFTALALRLAGPEPAPPSEVADAAERVSRYFTKALPLHALDEEESLLPRLRGHDPAVDRELDAMHAEHAAHGPLLDRVVALCDALHADPGRRAELAPALREVAGALERHFVDHLGREEAVIFPALARLAPELRAQMVAELRARRG